MNEVAALLSVLRAAPLREAADGPTSLADACLYAAAAAAVLMVEAATGTIIEANPAAALRLRIPRPQLLRAPLLQCFDSAAALGLTRAMGLVRREGKPRSLIAQTQDNRSEVHVTLSLVRVAAENYVLVHLAQSAAERRADKHAQTTSVVLDLIGEAGEGFLVTDLDLRVIYANQAFADLAGIDSPQQVCGESLVRWLELSQNDLAGLAAQMARREAVSMCNTGLRSASGLTRAVEICAVAVPDGEQPCWGFRIHRRAL